MPPSKSKPPNAWSSPWQQPNKQAPHDQTVLQGPIDAMDRQIDRLVYELYALTAEEIRIVEEGTAK